MIERRLLSRFGKLVAFNLRHISTTSPRVELCPFGGRISEQNSGFLISSGL